MRTVTPRVQVGPGPLSFRASFSTVSTTSGHGPLGLPLWRRLGLQGDSESETDGGKQETSVGSTTFAPKVLPARPEHTERLHVEDSLPFASSRVPAWCS